MTGHNANCVTTCKIWTPGLFTTQKLSYICDDHDVMPAMIQGCVTLDGIPVLWIVQ